MNLSLKKIKRICVIIQRYYATYGNVRVVEYKSAGSDKSILLNQITRTSTLAHVFDMRGFNGRTIAIYLYRKLK